MARKLRPPLIAIAGLLLVSGIVLLAWPRNGSRQVEADWKMATDMKTGLSFRYPEHFGTKYMYPLDWPPRLAVSNESFGCEEAGMETARAGITIRRTVNGRVYCVTKESQGAAGSIYTSYAYAFPKNGKTFIFTFTFRAVQCANYDNPQKTECENERVSFDLDGVIDAVARSVK